eukprot:gnl/TRDRNA2_/TRDRNA2_167709_c0_seq4.p1 gnl/TRDRNA2_/TRDRNA2_167709_c0~~gnl/TRDRNA2_/TRDRNA2_167709_c0_seq4.p1  ORF type:complete len:609 (+),score=102.42 gnl/TRDRNA2_/TRDRNA2_167709_c0_seq4:25-1827(+)
MAAVGAEDSAVQTPGGPVHMAEALLDEVQCSDRVPNGHEPSSQRGAMLREWLVLLVFCMNTALNSFESINFSVVTGVAKDTLNIDDDQVALFYPAFLFTVLIGMPLGTVMAERCERMALGFSILCNVSAAWVRYLGVQQRWYSISLASIMLNAAGAWSILTLPAQISQSRFPPERWALTTSIAVEANYFGWMLGSLVTPSCARSPSGFEHFMLGQACAALVVFPAFLLLYRPVREQVAAKGEAARMSRTVSVLGLSTMSRSASVPASLAAMAEQGTPRLEGRAPGEHRTPFSEPSRSPPSNWLARSPDKAAAGPGTNQNGSLQGGLGQSVERVQSCPAPAVESTLSVDGQHGHGAGGARMLLRVLLTYPSFGMQVLAYGMMGGVSFTVPGVAEPILEKYQFSATTTAWLNVAFIGFGVLTGISLGALIKDPQSYGKVLKMLFLACSLSLTGIASLLAAGAIPDPSSYHMLLVLFPMVISGATSLGFIGIGIEAAALYPAGAAYVCFAIEALIQGFGGLLAYVAVKKSGFVYMASFAAFATLLLFLGYNRYSVDGSTRDMAAANEIDAEQQQVCSTLPCDVPPFPALTRSDAPSRMPDRAA